MDFAANSVLFFQVRKVLHHQLRCIFLSVLLMNFPVSSDLMNIPVSSDMMNFFGCSDLINFPVSSDLMNFPGCSDLMNFPGCSDLINFSVSSDLKNFPVSSDLMHFPSCSDLMNFPVSSDLMNFPGCSEWISIPAQSIFLHISRIFRPRRRDSGKCLVIKCCTVTLARCGMQPPQRSSPTRFAAGWSEWSGQTAAGSSAASGTRTAAHRSSWVSLQSRLYLRGHWHRKIFRRLSDIRRCAF
jgi:hypothetical protein